MRGLGTTTWDQMWNMKGLHSATMFPRINVLFKAHSTTERKEKIGGPGVSTGRRGLKVHC